MAIDKTVITSLYAFGGVLITSITAIITRIFSESKKDKKQDEAIKANTEAIKANVGVIDKLKSKVAKIDDIHKDVTATKYRRRLKVRLKKAADNIIYANSLTNTDFIAFISNSRNSYIDFIDDLLIQEVDELNPDTIKKDMITFGKSLKNSTDFSKICDDPNFYHNLKVRVIYPKMEIFLMRIKEEILPLKKEFNGDFQKISTSILVDMITAIIKEYRESNK